MIVQPPVRWIVTEEDSLAFWEYRYRRDGVVGVGSIDCWRDIKIASLDKLLAQLPFESLLDVCCGDLVYMSQTRYFQNSLRNRRVLYHGIDGAANMVAAARSGFQASNITFEQMRLTDVIRTNLNRCFDVLVCHDVLFHLVDDQHYLALLDWLFGGEAKVVALSFLRGVPDGRSDEAGHYVTRDFSRYSVPSGWTKLWEREYPPKNWLRLAVYSRQPHDGG